MDPIIIVILLVLAFVGGMTGGPHMFGLFLVAEGVAYFAFGPWESVIFGVFAVVGAWAQVYLTFWSNKRAQRKQQEAQTKANKKFNDKYAPK